MGGITVVYTVALAGLTQNTLRTVTSLPTYANLDANNEYAGGFDAAIDWELAVKIGPSIGKKQSEMPLVVAMAAATKAIIMPQLAAPVAGPSGAGA